MKILISYLFSNLSSNQYQGFYEPYFYCIGQLIIITKFIQGIIDLCLIFIFYLFIYLFINTHCYQGHHNNK